MLVNTGNLTLPPPRQSGDDPQALIREARRRTRRRRLRMIAAACLAAAIAGIVYLLTSGNPPTTIAGTAATPFVNLRAFSGEGTLAFISRGRLWVLDGATGSLRELPPTPGYMVTGPEFSHDGRWLAYMALTSSSAPEASNRLWLAHADGSGAHVVSGLRIGAGGSDFFGWSPAADRLAVGAGVSLRPPYDAPTALDIVWPSGARRRLMTFPTRPHRLPPALESAVWSPDGSDLAVSTYSPARSSGTVIRSVPVDDPAAARAWFSTRNPQTLPSVPSGRAPSEQVIAELAGWWLHWGIAFWVFAGGANHNSDNTPLATLSRPGARPHELAQTLSSGLTDAVAPGPHRELALVSAGDGGRELGQGKAVRVCSLSAFACVALPGATTWTGRNTQKRVPPLRIPPSGAPGSGVSLDPSWSPSGRLLAYVKAPAAQTGVGPSGAWYQDHVLYVWDARTGVSTRLAGTTGASLPSWSADGHELLFVRGDGLWMISPQGGRPIQVEYPLYRTSEWHPHGQVGFPAVAYYGQVPWGQQLAWYSRH